MNYDAADSHENDNEEEKFSNVDIDIQVPSLTQLNDQVN